MANPLFSLILSSFTRFLHGQKKLEKDEILHVNYTSEVWENWVFVRKLAI